MKNYHLHLLAIYAIISFCTCPISEHQTLLTSFSSTVEVLPTISLDYRAIQESYNNLVFERIQLDQFDELLLINAQTPVNSEVNSSAMILIPSDTSIRTRKQEYISPIFLVSLEQLFTDAMSFGYNDLIINNIFRDLDLQETFFTERLTTNLTVYDYETAVSLTNQYVAKPGHSEHHLGLAMDISSTELYHGYSQLEDIPSFQWLYNNCYKYGLLLRYPKGKENITGIAYEPWHFRYVGQPQAEYMYKQNICFEEYVKIIKSDGIISFNGENNRQYTMYYIDNHDNNNFFKQGININNAVNISRLDGSSYIITVWNNETPQSQTTP